MTGKFASQQRILGERLKVPSSKWMPVVQRYVSRYFLQITLKSIVIETHVSKSRSTCPQVTPSRFPNVSKTGVLLTYACRRLVPKAHLPILLWSHLLGADRLRIEVVCSMLLQERFRRETEQPILLSKPMSQNLEGMSGTHFRTAYEYSSSSTVRSIAGLDCGYSFARNGFRAPEIGCGEQ